MNSIQSMLFTGLWFITSCLVACAIYIYLTKGE